MIMRINFEMIREQNNKEAINCLMVKSSNYPNKQFIDQFKYYLLMYKIRAPSKT